MLLAGCGASEPPPRVLVIGLDGADWSVIDRLSAAGDLPHITRLKTNGTWASLGSIEPMLSPIHKTIRARKMVPARKYFPACGNQLARREAADSLTLPKLYVKAGRSGRTQRGPDPHEPMP